MIKFGTGGWRALIGEEFTKENVRLLAQAIANLMKAEKSKDDNLEFNFVIGYDRRFLSDKAAKWMAEVLAGNKINVYFIAQVAPTPLVMFTVKKMKTFLGATVTASHNSADYNGVKVFTAGGRDATELVTDLLEAHLENISHADICSLDFEQGKNENLIKHIDPFDDYIDTILGMINIDAIRKRKLRVVLDPMYGVSKTCLQTILLTARCELHVIHDRHDTLFGGRLPSPTTHTLHRLRDTVVEKGYEIGIGTDGDADRLGIIDEQGNFIHPNDILALLYYYLLKYKGWKGGIVRNVSTTHLLDKIAYGFGEECYEVPVGFKHISSKMEATNALIGGESSGGLTIRGHILGKDGIFAASLLIELLSVTGKNLSELLAEINQRFGYYYMVEKNLHFTLEDRSRLVKKIFENKELPDFGYDIHHVNYQDGVKVYFENDGWISIRFSGTEPLLRIYAEMSNEALATALCDKMKAFLNL